MVIQAALRGFAVIVLAVSSVAQQCSNESFSIGYNGITAFEVANTDNSCRCAGPVTSAGGISRAVTLAVDNLTVVNAMNTPCPAACLNACPAACQLQNAAQDAKIAYQDATIAALNSSVLALRLEVANLVAQGCSSGGGGGGGSGGGSSFCLVTAPTSGYVVGEPSRVAHGASVTYACNTGFNLTGYASQLCIGGAFDHALPTCPPSPCQAVAPANGAVSASVVASGTDVTYSCNSGFTLSGTAVQRCTASVLAGSTPVCQGLPCTGITAPGNGTVSAASVPHGSNATYACNTDFVLRGNVTRTCIGGVLSGTQPACDFRPCTPGSMPFYNTATGCAGSIQSYTLPACVTTLVIDARGAQGGGSGGQGTRTGGLGARMVGTFSVTGGSVVSVLVGQAGLPAASYGGCGGGGGGGTFVRIGSTLLVAAGGGGGAMICTYNTVIGGNGGSGVTTTSGGSSGVGRCTDNSYAATVGGANGAGALAGVGGYGAGGGGYTGAGGGSGGQAFSSGGNGGCTAVPGGYGGGGSGYAGCCGSAGGGGGYSGGAGGNECTPAGGGGSYNAGTSQSNTAGYQSGHGQVILSWS